MDDVGGVCAVISAARVWHYRSHPIPLAQAGFLFWILSRFTAFASVKRVKAAAVATVFRRIKKYMAGCGISYLPPNTISSRTRTLFIYFTCLNFCAVALSPLEIVG